MDHSGRLRRIQSALEEHRLDFLLVTHLPNIRYLCGFTGSAGALVIGEESATFFTDGRYSTQAHAEIAGARIVIARKSPLVAAPEFLSRLRLRSPRLGLEPSSITIAMKEQVSAALSKTWKLVSAPQLIERGRMVKDKDEIRLITSAVQLGGSLFKIVRNEIRPGVKEAAVAAALEYEARRSGAEAMSFSTIIAAGKRSAVVHGRASSVPIPDRGFVVCDFGVILTGYCSDRTRTVHVGKPSAPAVAMYAAVRDAQESAIDAVRPGATAADIDAAARKVLRRHNLVRYFTHSTGHGLGLEIHEAPRLAAGQTQVLEAGMVITIEPGAYIPGKYGVRIEDVVVVKDRGCEVLSPADKDLIVI